MTSAIQKKENGKFDSECKERIEGFINEMKSIYTPELVEEPYHIVKGIPKSFDSLRKDAIVINACNDLLHIFEKTSDGSVMHSKLGAAKDYLMEKFAYKCATVKQANPGCGIDLMYGIDNKNKEAMIAELPFVGAISWHFNPSKGKEPIKEMLAKLDTPFELKKFKEKPVKLSNKTQTNKFIVDPRQNVSRLMNDYRVVNPRRGYPYTYEEYLRRMLQWEKTGTNTYNLCYKKPVTKETINNGFDNNSGSR